MISNAEQLNIALQQVASFADMLEAMRQYCKATNSSLFPHVSEGYIHKIREINAEIRAYLQEHPDAGEADVSLKTTSNR